MAQHVAALARVVLGCPSHGDAHGDTVLCEAVGVSVRAPACATCCITNGVLASRCVAAAVRWLCVAVCADPITVTGKFAAMSAYGILIRTQGRDFKFLAEVRAMPWVVRRVIGNCGVVCVVRHS